MTWTVECDNCGVRKHRYKPCEHCGFANGNEHTDQSADWGDFALTDSTIDLIDLFLDPDIQAARAHVHKQIDNGQLNMAGGRQQNVFGQGLTPGVKKVAKVLTDLKALQKQAIRGQRKNL